MKYQVVGVPALREIEPRGEYVTVWHVDGRRFNLTVHGAKAENDLPSTIAFMLGGRFLKFALTPDGKGGSIYTPEPTSPAQLRPSSN